MENNMKIFISENELDLLLEALGDLRQSYYIAYLNDPCFELEFDLSDNLLDQVTDLKREYLKKSNSSVEIVLTSCSRDL